MHYDYLKIHGLFRDREESEIGQGNFLRESLPILVNGLATVALAGFVFAHPVRLSAAVCIGDDEIFDIERGNRRNWAVTRSI